MNLFIDIATLSSVSSAFYAILLLLLFLFWRKNQDIEAILWWCGFPLFRLISTLISSDSADYATDFNIYVGNIAILLSDTFLMVGCMKFTRLKVSWKMIIGYLGVFLAVCIYQYMIGAGLTDRIKSLIVFDIIPTVTAIYALSRLDYKAYAIEKFFTIFWISFQLSIYAFWILINFDFTSPAYGSAIVVSLGLSYICHIFTCVGQIILTIAERRNQLVLESVKHKELEQELTAVLTKAQQANDEKTQFLTTMSHELRTPLNAILGFSESLKLKYYGELNEKQVEYVDNIFGGGELLLKLITDLLHLSNIDEGTVEIELEDINFKMLIEKTMPLLREIVAPDDGRLVINDNMTWQRESSSVYIDQIRAKQVLINFVSNAVKYSDEGTKIVLDIDSLDDNYFRISVADQGMGIQEDQYENIFKPFNRAGNENTKVEGIGVGLSIAKDLIEKMHGKIGFSSKVGRGSTFWINIPKSKQRQLPIGFN